MVGYSKFSRIYRPFHVFGAEHVVLRNKKEGLWMMLKKYVRTIGTVSVLIIAVLMTSCGKNNSSTEKHVESGVLTEGSSDVKEDPKALFAPVQLIESDDVSVSITDVSYDNTWGCIVEFCLENNTDEPVTYSIEDSYINDLKNIVYWNAEVPENTKIYEEVEFYLTGTEIVEVEKMTFDWLVYPAGNNKRDYLEKKEVDFILDESREYSPYTYNPSASDQKIFDNNDLGVYITAIDPEGYGGYTLDVYVENRGDSRIEIVVDKAIVNGIEINPYGAFELAPKKRIHSGVYWLDNDFADAEITDITSISLSISVIDEESFKVLYSTDFELEM